MTSRLLLCNLLNIHVGYYLKKSFNINISSNFFSRNLIIMSYRRSFPEVSSYPLKGFPDLQSEKKFITVPANKTGRSVSKIGK